MHQDQHDFLHPAPPSAGDGNDAERFRAWRRLCDALERAGAVSPHARWVIDFAITWVPFGGASPAELLETFGVTPARFHQLLREALEPQGAVPHLATLKRQLSDSILRAWAGADRPHRRPVRRAA
ncbi:hypothetical protein ACGFIU_23185 [Rhodococcus oryzae]|uniref:hypothetical protein n=1 Tax=Rhodococcus oryzae TaxID=2571143 RepID=UPI00371C8B60